MYNVFMIAFLSTLTLIHSFSISDLNKRVTALESKQVTNKGSVTATLEPIPEVKQEVKVIPTLYNNNTKIVFHNSKEFLCLARNIYYEAKGEPYIGQIAVAHITFNRAEKVGSFCEVVHKPKQFSWTLIKDIKKPSGKEWEMAKHTARMFARGVRVKNLEDVEHYHTAQVNPKWDNNMNMVAAIGGHQFYGE